MNTTRSLVVFILNARGVLLESLGHVLMKSLVLMPVAMKRVIFISSAVKVVILAAFATKFVVLLVPSVWRFVRFSVKRVMLVFLFFAVMIGVIAVIPIIIIGVGIVVASPIKIAIRGTAESCQGNK
jgi:hypothetical protein